MHPIDESDDDVDLSKLAEEFNQIISSPPLPNILGDHVSSVLNQVRRQSTLMVYQSTQYDWLVSLSRTDRLVQFYLDYIQILRSTSVTDYLTHAKNRVVANFVKLHMIIWNVTDRLDTLCLKLILSFVPSQLFKLLQLPQLCPSICLKETNARLIVHSTIGILHNILNHVPNVRASYRECAAVSILKSYLGTANEDWDNLSNSSSVIHYASLRTAALMVLSFLVDENENLALHTDDCYIVYLLVALDDSLQRLSDLYSPKFGYNAQELLIGLQNLAGSDNNKKALIQNNAMHHIETSLSVAQKLKTSNDNIGMSPNRSDPYRLAEKTLEFLWSLSFVPEINPYFTPGSDFRRSFEKFTDRAIWSPKCCQVAQGILRNIQFSDPSPFPITTDQVLSRMAIERRQPKRYGHLMISYQHSDMQLLLLVRDRLESLDYSVWMDVDYMRGSFLDAMAQGVQDAAAMILGLSQAFKNSPHCRQEVRYAYNLGIPLFPLQLEPNFTADGWLAMLLATIIYIPLHEESQIVEAVKELTNQLGGIGHKSRAVSDRSKAFSRSLINFRTDLPVQSSSPSLSDKLPNTTVSPSLITSFSSSLAPAESLDDNANSSQVQIKDGFALPTSSLHLLPMKRLSHQMDAEQLNMIYSWTPADVAQWLERESLSIHHTKLTSVDGPMLVELVGQRLTAPESLATSLYRDWGMQLTDQLRLFSALTKLITSTPITPQP